MHGIVGKSLAKYGGYDGFGREARGQSKTSVVQSLSATHRAGRADDRCVFPERSRRLAGAHGDLSPAVRQAFRIARAGREHESVARLLDRQASPLSFLRVAALNRLPSVSPERSDVEDHAHDGGD